MSSQHSEPIDPHGRTARKEAKRSRGPAELTVNLRHLDRNAVILQGEVEPELLGLETLDAMIRFSRPIRYDLRVERVSGSVLAQGRLELAIDCECVRCLKPFAQGIALEDWVCDLELGEPAAGPVAEDLVDLTPYLREDILLALPQHPLCEPGCGGLTDASRATVSGPGLSDQGGRASSPWSELDKLKL